MLVGVLFSFAYTFYPQFSTRTIRKSVAERAGCSKQTLLFEENISFIQSGINETITKLSWNFEENRTRDRFYFSNKKNRKKWNRQRSYVSAWPKWFAWRTNRPQVTRGLTADNEIPADHTSSSNICTQVCAHAHTFSGIRCEILFSLPRQSQRGGGGGGGRRRSRAQE